MRKVLGPVLALLMATALASPAQAGGAGAVSITQTFHNATQIIATPFPCTAEFGIVTFTYNGAFHGTVLTSGVGAGTGWFTFTGTGSFTFAPLFGGTVTYAGHVLAWDGENFNLKNYVATSTLEGRATGSDGSTFNFHDVLHITVDATGAVAISFDKPTCG
jgi:hypothetical protein